MEFLEIIGNGVYSDVFKVKVNGEICAFKQCYKSPEVDFIYGVNELDIISRVHKHPNIVKINSLTTKCCDQLRTEESQDYYHPDSVNFILELGDCDLASYIRNTPTGVYRKNQKKIMFDLLLALDFIHSRKVIHRDIKPANVIIFDSDGEIKAKLTDFGISKNHSVHGRNTPGAVTLSYRAPEIAREHNYDMKSDVWSLGLLFVDIIRKDDVGIFDFCDTDEELLDEIEAWKNRPISPDYTIEDCEKILDLINHMTKMDPKKRYSARDCLMHPYFSELQYLIHYSDKLKTEISPLIDYPDNPERAQIEQYIIDNSDSVIKLRFLFHAGVLLDQYLVAVESGSLPKIPTNLAFYCMQYLTMKSFNVLEYVPPFSKALGVKLSKEEIDQVENLERLFVCSYNQGRFYVDTLLEYFSADLGLKRAKKFVKDYYRNKSLKGKTHKEAAEILRAKK